MARVHLLDDELINKIAAGEVVERPASVVKELVENAIDAGATHVKVILKDGGRQLIQVQDDGLGMHPDDAVLAVKRHTTSKLQAADDLFQVRTMGFRGEALASIASVSRFTLQTQSREHRGHRVHIEDGKQTDSPWQGSPGTSMTVADLFYNVPARRSFLKTAAAEFAACHEFMQALALSLPTVGFTLLHNDREVFSVSPALKSGEATMRARAASLIGNDDAGRLIYVQRPDRHAHVEALISPPGLDKGTARHCFTFVNGRWVRDKLLRFAVQRGYHSHLMKGKFPIALLYVTVDPALVDVNVHPAKAELRFQYAQEVQNALVYAIRDALRDGNWASANPPIKTVDSPPDDFDLALPQSPADDEVKRTVMRFDAGTPTPSRTPPRVQPPLDLSQGWVDSPGGAPQSRAGAQSAASASPTKARTPAPDTKARSSETNGPYPESRSSDNADEPDSAARLSTSTDGMGTSSASRSTDRANEPGVPTRLSTPTDAKGTSSASRSTDQANEPGVPTRLSTPTDAKGTPSASRSTDHANEPAAASRLSTSTDTLQSPADEKVTSSASRSVADGQERTLTARSASDADATNGSSHSSPAPYSPNKPSLADRLRSENSGTRLDSPSPNVSRFDRSAQNAAAGLPGPGLKPPTDLRSVTNASAKMQARGTPSAVATLKASVPSPDGQTVIPWNDLQFIGSFARCFLLFEYQQQMLAIDQHAFHERVLYERLVENPDILRRTQPLLMPDVLVFSPTECERLVHMKDALDALGIQIHGISDTEIEVSAVPSLLVNKDLNSLLIAILGGRDKPSELAHDVLATMACHAAVRAGEELPEPELKALLREAESVDFYHNCPHGRRVFRWWKLAQVAAWFDR